MDMQVEVTENIHGENFRCGVDVDGRPFIGQRNNVFYTFSEHPHWNKMSVEVQNDIQKLINQANEWFREYESPIALLSPIVFFGELCGNSMQKGFTYPWTGLRVLYFDFFRFGQFYNPLSFHNICHSVSVPTVPIRFASMSLRDALKLNVERMTSNIANEPYIEGVVIKPIDTDVLNSIWKFHDRFIIKHKTTKFAENKGSGIKDNTNHLELQAQMENVSQFITEARIDHAIERLTERGVQIERHMRDMKYVVPEVTADVAREEFDGVLTNEQKKAIGKLVPKVYAKMLDDSINSLLN
jgi:hypothetical protein